MALGQNFNVSVIISNVQHLYTYQVPINFSSEMLEVTDVIQGDFLSRGTYHPFWQPKWNNTEGIVTAWETMLKPEPETAGSGELFKVAFHVKKAGGSILDLFNTQLVSLYQANIHHEIEDGIVTTAKLDFTPNVFKGVEYTSGKVFDMNITFQGAVENFYGFNITITYDKEVLNATSVTLIPLLAMPNINLTQINFTEGTILLNATCTSPAPSTNETGPLATITFEVLTVGTTEIEIVNPKLINVNGEEITHIIGKASMSGVYRNIGIIEASFSPLSVTAGENVTLSLKVSNNGGLNETFFVRVYAINAINALIGLSSEFDMAPFSNKTITMDLNTKGLEDNYTLLIFISYVPDETNLEDNQHTPSSFLVVAPKAEEYEIPFEIIVYVVIAIAIILVAITVFYRIKHRNKT